MEKTRKTDHKANWSDIAQAIRDSVSMEDVLTAYAPSTPRRNHRCPCPIHNGEDFNFAYNNDFYKCFVCGASGDAITFVKEVCGLQSMSDAMKKINADFKLDLPIDHDITPAQSAEIALRRAEREDKRRKEEAWWNEYHLVYDEWIRLDKLKRTADPESDDYAYAVKNIDKVSYMLDKIMDSKDAKDEKLEVVKPEVVFSADGIDKNGNPKLLISNFVAIMKSDSHYGGIMFNELSNRAEIHNTANGKLKINPWTDADEARSMNYIEQNYGIYSKDKHTAALRILFDERRYNPIIDIVDNIKWDGKNRCELFLRDWAKVDDTPYTREVSRLIFAGGIHRLYAPGTKFDDVPILMGEQGCGKSTLVRFHAVNDIYYGEVTMVEGQQAIEQLSGKWICEMSEMLALTKSKEQEAVKAFITRAVDSYRKPWDKNPSELPRRCILISTTNDYQVLVDKTGNRRFYPVEVHSNGYDVYAHEQEIRDYILQCWAEARERYKKHDMPNFASQSLVEKYREAQENAMQDDWRVGAIRAYLDRKNPGELTCVREVCHRALSPNPDFPHEPSLAESKDIGRILNKFKDFERVGVRKIGAYGKQNCWKKCGEETTNTELPFKEM